MPLRHSPAPPTLAENGDVLFTMLAADDRPIACEADADYLIALAPTNEGTDTMRIFGEMRDTVELTASEQYDLHGPDERGVVRLAPLIF
ncbi:MAG: hypothetical protein AB7O56_04610 [Bauldia sp.]